MCMMVAWEQSADASMAAEDAPLYWDAVWALVAVGQIDKAEQYLTMHSVNQLPPSALTAAMEATHRQRELVSLPCWAYRVRVRAKGEHSMHIFTQSKALVGAKC